MKTIALILLVLFLISMGGCARVSNHFSLGDCVVSYTSTDPQTAYQITDMQSGVVTLQDVKGDSFYMLSTQLSANYSRVTCE